MSNSNVGSTAKPGTRALGYCHNGKPALWVKCAFDAEHPSLDDNRWNWTNIETGECYHYQYITFL